jgi:CHAT domain-containing protein/Flp pilus assembly protein TadD
VFLFVGSLLSQDAAEKRKTVNAQANALFDKKDFDGALGAYREVAAIAAETKDSKEGGRAWLRIGTCLSRKQDLTGAMEAYAKAQDLSAAAGDDAAVADIYGAMLRVEFATGQADKAEKHARQALELYSKVGDKRMMAGMAVTVGTLAGERGDIETKISLLKQTIPALEAGGYNDFLANALNNLGVAYADQGDYERSIEYFRRATDLIAKVTPGDHTRVAQFHVNLGVLDAQLGRPKEALEEYAKAEAEAQASGDESTVMGVRTDRAWLYLEQEKSSVALAQLRPMVGYWEKSPERSTAATFFAIYETALLEQGDSKAVVDLGAKRLAEVRAMGVPDLLRRSLEPLGDAYAQLGQREQARAHYLEAISVTESVKLSGGEDERGGFLGTKGKPYLGMVRILSGDHQPVEALQYSERAKARLLLDVLRGGRAEINRLLNDAEKLRERQLSGQIARLDQQLVRAGKDAPADLITERDRLQSEMAAFRDQLYAKYPELRIQRGEFRPLSTEQLSDLLPDAGTALVEYSMDRRKLYVFAITRDAAGHPRVESQELAAKGLPAEVARFRAQLAGRDLAYRETARALYSQVLGPLAGRLNGKKRVVIVPDGVLWDLPFQALVTPRGKHMVEESTVFYAPSLTAAREMKLLRRAQADPSHTLLAFGAPAKSSVALPSLPESGREVRQIGQLYGEGNSAVYVGDRADKQRWKDEAPRYRILHVATHGVLNSDNPLSSFLDLNRMPGDAQDSVISAREILKMNLTAEITILSACETARGAYRFGEGMIGMSWAFLIAGTPTTVVSQWKVDSASTSELMGAFHRNLRAGVGGRADALRAAELELLQSEKYRHPFYWAGFVMIGDGY